MSVNSFSLTFFLEKREKTLPFEDIGLDRRQIWEIESCQPIKKDRAIFTVC